MADRVTIPTDLAQAIYSYLLARPMNEVEALVVALRQCEPPKDESPEVEG